MQAVHTNHLLNMHKIQFSLIVLVLLNVYGNRAIFWNIENSELLALHNAYRRYIKYGNALDQPEAESMLKLVSKLVRNSQYLVVIVNHNLIFIKCFHCLC